jgi:hypothetical protein
MELQKWREREMSSDAGSSRRMERNHVATCALSHRPVKIRGGDLRRGYVSGSPRRAKDGVA